jgi:hypothetical protein
MGRACCYLLLRAAVLTAALLNVATCDMSAAELADAGIADAGIADAQPADAQPADARSPDPMTYFLVAEWPGMEMHGDSYVLPVTRPEDIEHARNLVELGPEEAGRTIAMATIRLGTDGINRNLRAAGQPAWSWHVTELVSFADCSAEILDGWPGWIEQDPEGWMKNTPPSDEIPDHAGSIGFWGYTVVVELAGYPRAPDMPPGTTARTGSVPD